MTLCDFAIQRFNDLGSARRAFIASSASLSNHKKRSDFLHANGFYESNQENEEIESDR